MATPSNLPKGAESVSLSRAVLCNDCNEITEAQNGHCPICGCKSLMALAPILNRVIPEPPEPPGCRLAFWIRTKYEPWYKQFWEVMKGGVSCGPKAESGLENK